MHWLRFAVLVVLAALLQADLLEVITIAGIKPDLLLILLVFFAVYLQTHEAIITSFVIGFMADLIGSSMGPGTISLGLLGSGLSYLSRYISLKRMPFQALAIFLLVLAGTFLAYPLKRIAAQPIYQDLYGELFATALYTAILGPFLFLPVAWWMHIRIHRQGKRR